MNGETSKRNWLFLGWAVVCLSLAILILFHHIQDRQEMESFQRTAVTTTGLVTSASPGFQSRDDGEPPSISYRFTIKGKEYTGDSEEFIPEGDPVEIRYDPTDPNTNFSASHKHKSLMWNTLLILVCGIGVFLFIAGFNEKTARAISSDKHSTFETTPFWQFLLVIVGAIAVYLLFFRDR